MSNTLIIILGIFAGLTAIGSMTLIVIFKMKKGRQVEPNLNYVVNPSFEMYDVGSILFFTLHVFLFAL